MQLIPCSCAGSASQSFTAPQRCRTAVALTARAPPTLASRARMGTTPPTHWHQHWHPRRYRKSTWAPHRTDVPRRMRRHAPHRRRGHADRPCTGLGLRRHAPAPAWACAGRHRRRPPADRAALPPHQVAGPNSCKCWHPEHHRAFSVCSDVTHHRAFAWHPTGACLPTK